MAAASSKRFIEFLTAGRLAFAFALCLPLWSPSAAAQVPGACPNDLDTEDFISHNLSISFCELCDVGSVRIEVENPYRSADDVDMSDIVITEDLQASGLTYVPGTTNFSTSNAPVPGDVEPVVSGPNGSILTWTLDPAYTIDAPNGNSGNVPRLRIDFDVRRAASLDEEGLVNASRLINAAVEFSPSCEPSYTETDETGDDELPLNEPVIQVEKTGRNVDAGQDAGSYTGTVYGHEEDDVIWQIAINNTGDAPLQDFRFDDIMSPGNYVITHICDDEGDADSVATGGGAGDCVSVGATTTLNNVDVADLFGGGANPYIAAPANGSNSYYLVGRVTDSCTNRDNTVTDVEWGCQVDTPVGGIDQTSFGASVADATAQLSTQSVANSLDVVVEMTGTNLGQPMGTKGTVTITITNLTGGTVFGGTNGFRLRDVLPVEYVVDPTFDPVVVMAPAYGNDYDGMLDTITWTNPVAGTYPNLTSTDPNDPLGNTAPEFLLTSSTVNPQGGGQQDLLRHGDELTITFRTVLIDPQYYDREAYIDITDEGPNTDPPGTDPTETFQIDNVLDVWFEEFCNLNEINLTFNDSDTAEPEDIDLDMRGDPIVYILTNDDVLPVRVDLNNNGGHDADDYLAYVTFGDAMVVQTAPGSCSVVGALANEPWKIPVDLPPQSTTYECYAGTVPAGGRRRLNFEVAKNPDGNAIDDLTFRADVTGQVTLSDGTPLWFPDPIVRGDGEIPNANDYTVDALRARIVGYNLRKQQVGTCTENNPPDDEVQIGEECLFSLESGGWFGFDTPGFTYIAVQDIRVDDNLPDGQGYLRSVDPLDPGYSTAAISGVTLLPPPSALDEGVFWWTHNVTDAERIEEKDHWFRSEVETRFLNDPQDNSAPPNEHTAESSNILTSVFDAIFENPLTASEEVYTLDSSTIGYPPEFRRRVDLVVTEPRLVLTKSVCNETLYGVGPACTNFVPLADDGDAFDTYVWRITVENEASSGGVTRAPAFDVTVTSVTDPFDLQYVDPLETDGLDNDGNTEIDEPAGEGVIVPDNDVLMGAPAEVVASYTHSDALLRIDPGTSVDLYYRVDPYDDVAPLQTLTNSVTASYDSLAGDSGNQTAPTGANGEIGGARQYVSDAAEATIQIISVEVEPKTILNTSNTPAAGMGQPQPVSIGEEVEFELRTLIPVAQLRDFTIRDELPAGMRCAEAPVVDLDAPPYDAAGFMPGGSFVPTCTETEVVWSFGDQTVTVAPCANCRVDFGVQFIGRVDNVDPNRDGTPIRNGGTYTSTTVSYVDEASNTITLDFEAAEMVVIEPLLELEKTFAVETADAADRLVVTVTATNTGTAPAYNPRVLDDLTGSRFSFTGDTGGTNPPDTIDTTTLGPDSPIFSWLPGYEIPVGGTLSFTYTVEVDADVEPLEVLPNTAQADWTSLPLETTALNSSGSIGVSGAVDGMRNGALPNAADPLNDYEVEASDSVYVPSVAMDKTDLDPAVVPAVGAHKSFEVRIDLPEGATNGVRLEDDLASGSGSYVLADNADYDITYEFVGLATINGQPPAEAALIAVPADGASGVVTWDIGNVVTQAEDDTVVNDISPYIRIEYAARINNDLDTNLGTTLGNSATAYFINGDTAAEDALNDTTATVSVVEPAIVATKAATNATAGKQPNDPVGLGDTIEYIVTFQNLGNSIAHDVNIVDTLPVELQLDGSYAPTAQIGGIDVPGFNPVPANAPAGPLVWGSGNGDPSIDLAPGDTLELTYHVNVVAPADESVALSNIVWTDWTSLDDASSWERTGAGCPTTTAPDDYCYGPASADSTPVPVGPPDALVKDNTQPTATIGETFSYLVTLPGGAYPLPLYDVQILDDLGASAADLRFVSVRKVSGSGDWEPVNTGTETNLVIEDPTGGIDIPLGEQAVIEITVRLDDTPTNVAGLDFVNTADYTYNRLNDAPATVLPGAPDTSPPMTIVEPYDLTLTKSGPPQMQRALPGVFTLDVQNIGDSAAYGVTLYDRLPNEATGGTCDAGPGEFAAQVFETDGVTPVSPVLVQDTDFSVAFAGDPDCEFSLSVLTPAGAIGPGERLIVTYETLLDLDSEQDTSLTNIAGATEWFSIDVSDPAELAYARTYTRTLTDGTPGTLDHEDEHTLVVFVPMLQFEKTVVNVTTGEDPGTVATPGDVLRYSLYVENLSDTPLDGFSIVDELDALNAAPSFLPGSLTVVTVPPAANVTATDPNGGAAGTGLLDIAGLSLGPSGDTVLIEFEATLAPVIANGSLVSNQSTLLFNGLAVAVSDDPNVNGPAAPDVADDEDPTTILIESAPELVIEKISTYLTGDPTVLFAGEDLRYTITVQNVGTDNVSGVTLEDLLPASTSYVAGSTTLNGTPIADGPNGTLPLTDGIDINAPGDPTPGVLNAAAPDNVATITFDVTVYPDVLDGTVISNQAFVSAPGYGILDQPSDDPRTTTADDPTRDIVGNLPFLFAAKSAVLEVDLGTPGIVDPGDVLRYTIAIDNYSPVIPATAVYLTDGVPLNTSYVADSTTLNGLPVGQPDGGTFPLENGLPVSSADLTPPVPTGNEGTINPGGTAVVTFDLRVDDGVATGTLITNQALVASEELPTLLTDGDGNPATGPEPTVVVVGDAQQLAITKDVAVVDGGAALAGGILEYVVTVTNIGAVPASYVVITDELDDPVAGQLSYVDMSATLDGLAAGVTVLGTTITADYGTEYGPLPVGESATLRFRAMLDGALEDGTTVTNIAEVGWNDPPQYLEASVSIDIGGVPGSGILSGTVFHDADFDNTPDGTERLLEGWTVELRRNDELLRAVATDAEGNFTIGGVPPNYLGNDIYALRFLAPGAGSRTAAMGQTDSDFTDGLQRIDDIVVTSGSNLRALNLPIDPNGVVYDSVARLPLAGAIVSLVDSQSEQPIAGSCFDDPNQQGQVTIANGYYKFDLNFSDPSCPSGGDYMIRVVPPGSNFVGGVSELIPPATDRSTFPFDVPACGASNDDAIPSTTDYCEVQTSEFEPPPSERARSPGTVYHSRFRFDDSRGTASAQLFNNHIPLDPILGGAVSVTKTTPRVNVTRGELVPYVITATNSYGADLPDVSVVDRFPAGFRYVEGSARFDGEPREPEIVGRELVWSDLYLAQSGTHEIKLLLAVGAGVTEGEFVNRAQAVSSITGNGMSEEATATVRIVPDPTFDCTDVTGKVFDDVNRNGYQDAGETGIAGVRLVTARGLAAKTDTYGRYHITCAIVPNETRGSNFVIKIDDRTLPSGFRSSTRPVQIQRATRGKALKVNFGASIHRVVGLDIADAVFEPGTAEMRGLWKPRIGLLIEELRKSPAVLRLSYVADVENEHLVDERVESIKKTIMDAWTSGEGGYVLVIEPEVYWRRGEPVRGKGGAK